MSGNSLAVFGSTEGAGSALASSTGAGSEGAATIRTGTSGFGAAGGGGMIPVLLTS